MRRRRLRESGAYDRAIVPALTLRRPEGRCLVAGECTAHVVAHATPAALVLVRAVLARCARALRPQGVACRFERPRLQPWGAVTIDDALVSRQAHYALNQRGVAHTQQPSGVISADTAGPTCLTVSRASRRCFQGCGRCSPLSTGVLPPPAGTATGPLDRWHRTARSGWWQSGFPVLPQRQ